MNPYLTSYSKTSLASMRSSISGGVRFLKVKASCADTDCTPNTKRMRMSVLLFHKRFKRLLIIAHQHRFPFHENRTSHHGLVFKQDFKKCILIQIFVFEAKTPPGHP